MKHTPRIALLAWFCLAVSTTLALEDKKEPAKKPADVFTNAAEAGPDFAIQGEYQGELAGDKFAAQVVALGGGKFDVYFLTGGLPGTGWDTKGRTKVPAVTEGDKTALTGAWSGAFSERTLNGKNPDGAAFALKKVEGKSPSLGAKPPEGALVLFDGSNADEWQGGKVVEDKLLYRGTTSKKGIGAGKLHVEFRTPFQPKAARPGSRQQRRLHPGRRDPGAGQLRSDRRRQRVWCLLQPEKTSREHVLAAAVLADL